MKIKYYKATRDKLWNWFISLNSKDGNWFSLRYYLGKIVDDARYSNTTLFEYIIDLAKKGMLVYKGKPVKYCES